MIFYLDASSIVKLYVQEAGSDAIRRLIDEADAAGSSRIGYVEVRAALAKVWRQKRVNDQEYRRAVQAFNSHWPRYMVIGLSARIGYQASELAEKHDLKGYDAVHLASVLALNQRLGEQQLSFSSWDQKLNRAARAEGLTLAHQGGPP